MKALFRSFFIFLIQIASDRMLYAILAVPLLAGGAFRFGLPLVESRLIEHLGQPSMLSGYYLLFDLFLAAMTPYMICFTSAMVLLAEIDENIAAYIAVTPVGKSGYILSRLIFPALLSFLISTVIVHYFSLTTWALSTLVIVCLLSSLLGVVLALLVVAFSHNRVEGMALAKISSVVLLGLMVPFFLFSSAQYLFAPLPSFWIAKFCLENNPFAILPALATALLWIWGLYRQFSKKLA